MTTHDRDKVIASEKEAGFGAYAYEALSMLDKFYAIAHEAGRVAEREELSEIFEKLHPWLTNIGVVAIIRKRSTK